MATPSPFATSFRQDLSSMQGNPQYMGGLGSMLQQYRAQLGGGQSASQPRPANPFAGITPERITNFGPDTANFSKFSNGEIDYSRPSKRPEPVNPFAENEQYQAMMEYQKSMQPQQEQIDRMNELRTAFEGTGGYKDYRISQMEQQLQQRQQNPRMGMGLGGMRPTGMDPYQNFNRLQQMPQRGFGGIPNNYGGPQGGYGQMPQRNPYQQGGYGQQQGGYGMQGGYGQQYQQPQQQYGQMGGGYQQNPYQQQRPQPQQFGGYGMGQSSQGGYGGYGGMSNAYAPQQYGQQNMGQPQQFASYMR